ncbi:MAG: hypothetical protein A2Z88_06830, partial [Omnitrophica WOR_2 bacterium GWA2_47_8]
MKKIGIVGIWHQGAVASACFGEAGFHVIGVDSDKKKIDKLSSGNAPLFEPGLDDLLKSCLQKGTLLFSSSFDSLKDCDAVFLMHDTPVDEFDKADISGVLADASSVAPSLQKPALIVVTAQVPVGTCSLIADTIRKANPSLDFTLAYIPENLRLGEAIRLFKDPALPVIGADDEETFQGVKEIYSRITNAKWNHVSLKTAEMTKHALNAFIGTTITFGNELGRICDEVGADGKMIAQMLKLEPRIGSKAMLFPGLGFSGGTIARDIQTLMAIGKAKGTTLQLLDGLWASNTAQNALPVEMLRECLGTLRGKIILVLGLTYKPGTST